MARPPLSLGDAPLQRRLAVAAGKKAATTTKAKKAVKSVKTAVKKTVAKAEQAVTKTAKKAPARKAAKKKTAKR